MSPREGRDVVTELDRGREPRKLTFDGPGRPSSACASSAAPSTSSASRRGRPGWRSPRSRARRSIVTHDGGTLTVAYEDLPWKGLLKWLDRQGWQRQRRGLARGADRHPGRGRRGRRRGGDLRDQRPHRRCRASTATPRWSGCPATVEAEHRLRQRRGPGRLRRPAGQHRLRRPDRRRGHRLRRSRADSVSGNMVARPRPRGRRPTSGSTPSPARSPSASPSRATRRSTPTPPAARSAAPSTSCGSPGSGVPSGSPAGRRGRRAAEGDHRLRRHRPAAQATACEPADAGSPSGRSI